MENFDLSARLRTLRKSANLSQKQLSERIIISPSMISQFEKGVKRPSHEALIRYASQFHVTIDFLLGVERRAIIDVSGLTEEQQASVRRIVAELEKQNKKA